MNTVKAALVAAVLAVALAGGLLASPATPASTIAPSLTVIREGGAYEPVKVLDSTVYSVKCDGGGCPRSTLYKSVDAGVTQTACAVLPNAVGTLSRLHSGTLIATTDGSSRPWRSTDGCASWQPVKIADPLHPGAYLSALPSTSSLRYYLLGNSGIVDDGTYGYMASYNTPLAGVAVSQVNLTNYVWRSSDDGQTWSLVNQSTTHKHIHGQVAVPGSLYELVGDDAGCGATTPALCTDGVLVSHDAGATFRQVCATCVTTEAALTGDGRELVYDTDRPYASNEIDRLDVTTGAARVLALPAYESVGGGAYPTADGSFLLGTDYEPVGVGYKRGPDGAPDTSLHVYGVVGDTVSTLLSRPIVSTSLDGHLDVRGVLPGNVVVIYRSGYGAIYARYDSGTAAATTTAPTTSTAATTTAPATTTTAVVTTTPSCT
jgi:hypothetical protein